MIMEVRCLSIRQLKVNVGSDQEMAQSEVIPTSKFEMGRNNQVIYTRKHIVSPVTQLKCSTCRYHPFLYVCNLYMYFMCLYVMPMCLFIVIVHCICNSPVYGRNKECLLTYY